MTKLEKHNEFKDKLIKGLELSYEKLILEKRRKYEYLIVRLNGEIVKIKP